ncbi:MAG: porin family protein, partial [Myxococcales bacterium]|nr:porin family protein [Myxococcales bacterium]
MLDLRVLNVPAARALVGAASAARVFSDRMRENSHAGTEGFPGALYRGISAGLLAFEMIRTHLVLGKAADMSRRTILLAVACCLLPAVASAVEDWRDSPFHRSGFYGGLSGSYMFDQGLQESLEDSFTEAAEKWNNARTDPNSPLKKTQVASSGSVGINGRLGYRFTPWIAGEMQVEYMPPIRGEVGVTNKTLEQTSSGATLVIPRKVETLTSTHEIISATLNARVFFPLGRVQPYALGGAGIMHSQTTGNYRSYCIQTRNCSDTDPPLDAGSGILEDGF